MSASMVRSRLRKPRSDFSRCSGSAAGLVSSGDGVRVGSVVEIGLPVHRAMAACMIAVDMATHSALPTARCALRLPFGIRHVGPKPMRMADSRAVITLWVWPSRSHHVKASATVDVRAHASQEASKGFGFGTS